MKFFGIAFFLFLAFFLQCGKGVSDAQNQTNARPESRVSVNPQNTSKDQKAVTMNEIFSAQGVQDEIAYKISGRLQKKGQFEGTNYANDTIVIEYALENMGAKNLILFDRGHSGSTNDVVYAAPLADGTLELSMKAFLEPADKRCPARFVAVTPRGTLLEAGKKVADKVYFELPLKSKTPFDDCEPRAELAANASKIKFCFGYLEAPENVKIDDDGNIRPAPDVKKQRLICTGAGEIK